MPLRLRIKLAPATLASTLKLGKKLSKKRSWRKQAAHASDRAPPTCAGRVGGLSASIEIALGGVAALSVAPALSLQANDCASSLCELLRCVTTLANVYLLAAYLL